MTASEILERQRTEAERVRTLLLDTVTLLIRNGTSDYFNNITIEGVIGVTVDKGMDNERAYIAHIDRVEKTEAALAEEAAMLAAEVEASIHEELSPRKRRCADDEDGLPEKSARLDDLCRPPYDDDVSIKKETEVVDRHGDVTAAVVSSALSHMTSPTHHNTYQSGEVQHGEIAFGELRFYRSVRGHNAWRLYHAQEPGFVYATETYRGEHNYWQCSKKGKNFLCRARAKTKIMPLYGPKAPGPLVNFSGEHSHPPLEFYTGSRTHHLMHAHVPPTIQPPNPVTTATTTANHVPAPPQPQNHHGDGASSGQAAAQEYAQREPADTPPQPDPMTSQPEPMTSQQEVLRSQQQQQQTLQSPLPDPYTGHLYGDRHPLFPGERTLGTHEHFPPGRTFPPDPFAGARSQPQPEAFPAERNHQAVGHGHMENL